MAVVGPVRSEVEALGEESLLSLKFRRYSNQIERDKCTMDCVPRTPENLEEASRSRSQQPGPLN